jgi:hypothetical protein
VKDDFIALRLLLAQPLAELRMLVDSPLPMVIRNNQQTPMPHSNVRKLIQHAADPVKKRGRDIVNRNHEMSLPAH